MAGSPIRVTEIDEVSRACTFLADLLGGKWGRGRVALELRECGGFERLRRAVERFRSIEPDAAPNWRQIRREARAVGSGYRAVRAGEADYVRQILSATISAAENARPPRKVEPWWTELFSDELPEDQVILWHEATLLYDSYAMYDTTEWGRPWPSPEEFQQRIASRLLATGSAPSAAMADAAGHVERYAQRLARRPERLMELDRRLVQLRAPLAGLRSKLARMIQDVTAEALANGMRVTCAPESYTADDLPF